MTYPQQPQPPQQQPPAYYAPMPPAPKKTKKWPWVVGIVVALVVIGAAANGGKTPTTPAASTPGASAPVAPAAPVENAAPAAKVRTVIYEVTGTGTAGNITYTTDGMTSTEQVGDVPLPWSKTIELPANEALQIVQVLAQNGGDGEISATITVDGKVVKTGKSTGAYAVVSVNESIGTLGK